MTKKITIREFRSNLSQYLDKMDDGELFEVRGVVIAKFDQNQPNRSANVYTPAVSPQPEKKNSVYTPTKKTIYEDKNPWEEMPEMRNPNHTPDTDVDGGYFIDVPDGCVKDDGYIYAEDNPEVPLGRAGGKCECCGKCATRELDGKMICISCVQSGYGKKWVDTWKNLKAL